MRILIGLLVCMFAMSGCLEETSTGVDAQDHANDADGETNGTTTSPPSVEDATADQESCSSEEVSFSIKNPSGHILVGVDGETRGDQEAIISVNQETELIVQLMASHFVQQLSFHVTEKDGDGTVLAEGGGDVAGGTEGSIWKTDKFTVDAGEYIVHIVGERAVLADWTVNAQFEPISRC